MDLQPAPMAGLAESCDTGLCSPSSPVPMSEKPVKKATRQWAAWTRQEEENFFNALRQVGKNFEKITCRVQSKNKDQVRHYYYRLVRRMNKLLGPGFRLDAKNSKDTISAMLRWWSLLEKYSCTSSKLHLKPRRFKTFVEALAHQLLKDRNKSRRKRLPHGENFPPIPETSATIIRSGLANESHPVTALILNGQFTQKVGSSKGGSTKGAAVVANNLYSRGGPFAEKVVRPRRRTNLVASAAYKRWEKAAMAGVSLVADAAEQLEQSNNHSNNACDQATTILSHKHYCATGGENVSFATSARQPTCNNFSEVPDQIGNAQPASKLKLQLFPVDEGTCKALEKDEHNPYLELTLSSRKRISSIVEHLHRKWGSSSIASGELTLFPYSVNPDFASGQRWTVKDKSVCAGYIYLIVGSPAVFRLRYGWLVNDDLGIEVLVPPSGHSSDCAYKEGSDNASLQNSSSGDVHIDESRPQELPPSVAENASVADASFVNEPMVIDVEDKAESSHTESQQDIHMEENDIKERCDEEETRLVSDVALAGGWADNLVDLSVGELLFESSRNAASVSVGSVGGPIDPSPEQVPFSSDSFDAVIAAHVSGYKEQSDSPYRIPQSSFWDAEETCDGFSFRTVPSTERSGSSDFLSTGFSKQNFQEDVGFHGSPKSTKIEPPDYDAAEKEMEPESRSSEGSDADNPNAEKSLGLADIFWPDSLGALDLDIPPSRYVADDLFYGDSISLGLSRLMASSLDAFPNVSLFSFSLDKRESSK